MAGNELEDLTAFAGELAAASGREILRHFRTPVPVEDKSADDTGADDTGADDTGADDKGADDKGSGIFDPVTEADRSAERIMRDMIRARFPAHGIRGEEYPDHNPDAETVWVLDPIDGTKSFIIGFCGWATLIGLMRADTALLGLAHQPFTGESFLGHSGTAQYRGPHGSGALKSRDCAGLSGAILTTTSPSLIEDAADRNRYDRLEAAVRLARYGGDCYGYCMLAAGHLDLVAETGLKAHDIVPLIPIIEGAGGIVTDWHGAPRPHGGRVLAAGGPRSHEAALEILGD